MVPTPRLEGEEKRGAAFAVTPTLASAGGVGGGEGESQNQLSLFPSSIFIRPRARKCRVIYGAPSLHH